MIQTRRSFLAEPAVTIGAASLAISAAATNTAPASPDEILSLFKSLPGDVAIKIRAPGANGNPEFLIESNSA